MKLDTRIKILKDEYLFLESLYEDTSGKAHAIKGWSISVALATIGTGLLYEPTAYLLGIFAALLFWGLEAYWRSFTHYYVARIMEIETAFAKNQIDRVVPLQIFTSWQKTYVKSRSNISKYFFKGYVVLPHLGFAIISLVLYCLNNN